MPPLRHCRQACCCCQQHEPAGRQCALGVAYSHNAQSSTVSLQTARTLICQACSSETPASGVCGASSASSPADMSTTAGSEGPCMHMLLSACTSPQGYRIYSESIATSGRQLSRLCPHTSKAPTQHPVRCHVPSSQQASRGPACAGPWISSSTGMSGDLIINTVPYSTLSQGLPVVAHKGREGK